MLSVSMTKSAGGFGLGFIMEDIVLVNRVDPGGQAQVRPRTKAQQKQLRLCHTETHAHDSRDIEFLRFRRIRVYHTDMDQTRTWMLMR